MDANQKIDIKIAALENRIKVVGYETQLRIAEMQEQIFALEKMRITPPNEG